MSQGYKELSVYKNNLMVKYSIGLDIGKEKIYTCFSMLDEKQQLFVKRSSSFPNNSKGFVKLSEWINKERKLLDAVLIVIMEATGVYHEQCALYLYEQGFDITVVLPNKAKKYIAALGIKTKNDKSDAAALSHMGARQSMDLWKPMGRYFYELRCLTRHHESLQEQKTATCNQIEAIENSMYCNKEVMKSLKKILKTLEAAILSTEIAIKIHIQSNEEVYKKVKNIITIKGVGLHTIAVILAESNGFLLFKNQSQLISYAGYDVVENQSGKHVGKTKISKKGNSHIRRALHMPSLCTVTHKEPIFLNIYNRTFERHKIKMKSYTAIQKKLLCLIYTLWKNNTPYDREYHTKIITREEEVEHSSRFDFEEVG